MKEASYAEQHSLDGYTEKEIKDRSGSNRVKIARDSKQVYKFIEDALVCENKGEKLLLGKVTENLACRIREEININLLGYNLELRSNDIKHAHNRHGNDEVEKLRGQRAVTTEDFLRFVDIVTKYDDVKLDTEERNGLIFQKNINGKSSAVSMYAHGNKSLSLKTMYISRN
jgi:hypothetical protein